MNADIDQYIEELYEKPNKPLPLAMEFFDTSVYGHSFEEEAEDDEGESVQIVDSSEITSKTYIQLEEDIPCDCGNAQQIEEFYERIGYDPIFGFEFDEESFHAPECYQEDDEETISDAGTDKESIRAPDEEHENNHDNDDDSGQVQ